MRNIDQIEEVRSFCKKSAAAVVNCIDSEDYFLNSEDDAWFLDELRTRIIAESAPDQFFFLSLDLPKSFVGLVDDLDCITATVAVFRDAGEFSISADNAPLDGSASGLHMNVFLSSEFSEAFYSGCQLTIKQLFDEVENSIRHEFEHIIQDEYPSLVDYLEYHKINFRPGKEQCHLCLYLVQPTEVAAHVRGYEQISSNHFEFYKNILTLLRGYTTAGHLTSDEEKRVFLCWKDWFQRNTYIEDEERTPFHNGVSYVHGPPPPPSQ